MKNPSMSRFAQGHALLVGLGGDLPSTTKAMPSKDKPCKTDKPKHPPIDHDDITSHLLHNYIYPAARRRPKHRTQTHTNAGR